MPQDPDKSAKYDRQLRLWAANGQAALEEAHLGLIGATATGTECLKNLVLPGIGAFTIIDPHKVTKEDTGNNFFVDRDSIGRSRAETTCRLLQELNPDVSGTALDRDAADIIQSDASYFTQFSIVIVADLDPDSTLELSKVLWQAQIPLIIVQSIGFFGYLRIAVPEHTIIESHPDAIVDLRMDAPWPELSQFAGNMNLEAMNDNEHTHVPYILLLLHYLELWRHSNGHNPTTYEEKNEFKKLIRGGMRNADEDNFDEAVNNVWRACTKTSVPSEIQRILATSMTREYTQDTSSFWFLARAVSQFVVNEGHGLLPVSGTLPDMKADTTRYITLQKIYRQRASDDISAVKAHLQRHLESLGFKIQVIDEEIEVFCKHAAYLKVIHYRSYEQEMTSLNTASIAETTTPIAFHFARRAAETVKDANADALTKAASESCKLDQTILSQACHEVARSGNGELHNIASLMGGVASQETIKLITRQYVPANNTILFDGVKSVIEVYEL